MKFSIITVCLNSERTLEETFKSLTSQDYKDIEYIVIDGGSKDRTVELIDKYRSNIDVLISEKDSGIFDAMNKGVKVATGDLIYFLNSDDRFFDEKVLSDVALYVSENSQKDFFYGGVVCKNIFGGSSENLFLKEISETSFKCGQHIKHQSIFVKRALYERFGFLEITYKVSAVYEWQSRIIKSGIEGKFMDRIIAYYDQRGYSSKGTWAQYVEKTGIILKHFGIFFAMFFFLKSLLKFGIMKFLKKTRLAPTVSSLLNKLRKTTLRKN